jgi:hypothetical protein
VTSSLRRDRRLGVDQAHLQREMLGSKLRIPL